MRPTLALAALAIALAGCLQEPTADPTGEGAPVVTGSEAASPTPEPTASGTDIATGDTIPTALHGRWGMVPADCTSTRGDNKGLLTVDQNTLRFYESRAKLGAIKQRTDTSIRAAFAFDGEGSQWTRDVELSLSGNTLTRTERGGEEPGGPFTHTKCAA